MSIKTRCSFAVHIFLGSQLCWGHRSQIQHLIEENAKSIHLNPVFSFEMSEGLNVHFHLWFLVVVPTQKFILVDANHIYL